MGRLTLCWESCSLLLLVWLCLFFTCNNSFRVQPRIYSNNLINPRIQGLTTKFRSTFAFRRFIVQLRPEQYDTVANKHFTRAYFEKLLFNQSVSRGAIDISFAKNINETNLQSHLMIDREDHTPSYVRKFFRLPEDYQQMVDRIRTRNDLGDFLAKLKLPSLQSFQFLPLVREYGALVINSTPHLPYEKHEAWR
jgi:hypothetical protein